MELHGGIDLTLMGQTKKLVPQADRTPDKRQKVQVMIRDIICQQ